MIFVWSLHPNNWELGGENDVSRKNVHDNLYKIDYFLCGKQAISKEDIIN